jgi:XisH protein
MSVQEPNRKLYLAVSKSVYRYYFQQPSIQFVVNAYNVSLLVFNPLTEKIDQWIEK